jgi:hypothetical protein
MGVNFRIYLTDFYLFVTRIYLYNNQKGRLLMMEIIQKPWGRISADCKKIAKKVFKKFAWPSSGTFWFLLHNQGTTVCEHLDHSHPFCMQYLCPSEYMSHIPYSLCEELCPSLTQDLLGQTYVQEPWAVWVVKILMNKPVWGRFMAVCFFFFGRNFAKFRPEKYDFELCKRFSMGNAQI